MQLSGIRQLLFNFYPLRWASEQRANLVCTSIFVGLKALAIEVAEQLAHLFLPTVLPPMSSVVKQVSLTV